MASRRELAAKIEPFDSFWEGPEDVEKGYKSFYQFYKHNYLPYLPEDRNGSILVISCGPGYFVNLLREEGYKNVLGIDSFAEKVKFAQQRNLDCRQADAFEFLENSKGPFDVIFCEQELNHLTKQEIIAYLDTHRKSEQKDPEHKWKAATYNHYLTALIRFFEPLLVGTISRTCPVWCS